LKKPFLLALDLQHFAEGDPPIVGTPTPNDPPKADPMIPKNRFDEVNSKLKEALTQIETFNAAETERQKQTEEQQRKQAEEQGKFQQLYQEAQKQVESYKKFEERTTQLETVITNMVETKLKAVPQEFHELVPENLTAEQTLDWLNKAEGKGLFKAPEPQEIGKPFNHSNDKPKVDSKNMSALDKILSGLGGK
jgi:hypothetical protein